MFYVISTYFYSILQSNNYCTHHYIVLLICHTVPRLHNVLDMVHTAYLIYTARQDTLQYFSNMCYIPSLKNDKRKKYTCTWHINEIKKCHQSLQSTVGFLLLRCCSISGPRNSLIWRRNWKLDVGLNTFVL